MQIVNKFQEGGTIPTGQPVEQAPQEQNPLLQIAQVFAEGLQTQNCEMLAQGAQAFLQLLQQELGRGQAPIGAEQQGEPIFKKGGKIVRRRKCSK